MEAVEQDRGACGGEIRCTLCHSAHISGPQAGAPDRAEHLATCVECHQELATLAGARSHSHHDADQASCLDCHMPRIVQGFTGYNRSHRISSPSEPEILATGMPNTCNLCHLDRSLAWTRDTIASRWGTRVTLSPSLMPEFGANFELAASAYARSPLGRTALPALTRHLEEPNAYVRLRFLLAVGRILGRRLSDEEYTLTGGDERRQTQLRLLRGRLPNL